MKNNHLNDIEIQKFSFHRTDCETEIIKHVSSCKVCKQKVDDYLLLAAAIKDQADPSLAYNLSELVLEKLPDQNLVESSNPELGSIFITIFSVLILFMIFLFVQALGYLLNTNSWDLSYLMILIVGIISAMLVIEVFRIYRQEIQTINSL